MQPRAGSDNADYWWYRAEELRAKADAMRDLDAHRSLLGAAEACERLARLMEAEEMCDHDQYSHAS